MNKSISNTYIEKLNEKYEIIINNLKEEENIIKEIEKKVKKLDTSCHNTFNNKDVNKICNNYKKYYETIINIFVNDVKDVNDIVKKYNENNTDKLEEYQTNYNYIDYNKDGKYLERE